MIKNIVKIIFSNYAIYFSMIVFCFFKNIYILNNYTKILSPLMLLYAFLSFTYRCIKNKRIFTNRVSILKGLIIFFALFSIIINKQWLEIINYKYIIIFIFNIIILFDTLDLSDIDYKKIYYIMLFAMCIILLYVILSWIKFLFYDNSNRPIGLCNDIMIFAIISFCGFISSIYCYLFGENKRFFPFACLWIFIMTVIIEQQRAVLFGMMATIVFIIIMLIITKKTKYIFKVLFNKKALLIICFSILILIVLCIFGIINFDTILKKIHTNTTSWRYEVWHISLQNFLTNNNKLFGTSCSLLRNQLVEFINKNSFPFEINTSIRVWITTAYLHSVVLEQLFINGIVGLLLLLFLYVLIVFKLFKLWLKIDKYYFNKPKFALIVCCTLMCIVGIFDSFFDRPILFDIFGYFNLFFCMFSGFLFKIEEE